MRFDSIFMVFSVVFALGACSASVLPVEPDCLSLCEQGALCSVADGVSCEVTCQRWEEATDRYSCEPQYQAVLDCAEANLECGPCLEVQQAWASCVVDGMMTSASSYCNTWTCMSYPARPSDHTECVGWVQEWIFLADVEPAISWIERGNEIDECARCTEENFGVQNFDECNLGEALWKTTCPVCRD